MAGFQQNASFVVQAQRALASKPFNRSLAGLAWTCLTCLVWTLCLVDPTSAETPPLAAAAGRFAIAPTANGFMRLDTQTGVMSLCTVVNGAPECRTGPDERAALESEIARLGRENADLKSQLRGAPSQSIPSPSNPTSKTPSDEDVDRALQLMEKFVRRMMRIMKDDQSDNPI